MLGVLAIIVFIDVFVMMACLIVSGRKDDEEASYWEEHHKNGISR